MSRTGGQSRRVTGPARVAASRFLFDWRSPGPSNRITPVTNFRRPLPFLALDGSTEILDPVNVPMNVGLVRGRPELGLLSIAVLYGCESTPARRWVLCRYRSDPRAAAVPGKEWEREESPRELTAVLAMSACRKYGIKPPAALLAQMPEIPPLAAERPEPTSTLAAAPTPAVTPSSEARDLLVALHALEAINEEHRRPWPEVCDRARLALGDRCCRRARDQLRKAGLVRSKHGRDGGVWVSPTALELAQDLAQILGQNSVN
jgi:hypothetical protein